MFSKDLEQSIGQCYKRTREARYEFMTVEHLLLALLDNPSAEGVLRAVGADLPRLRDELENAIEVSVNRLAEDDGRDTQPTLGFQRVLQRAVYHVQSSGKKEVTGANVLVAIFGEKDSHAVYFLNQQDVHRLDVVNYISHGIAKADDASAPGAQEGEAKGEVGEGESRGDPLTEFAANLNEAALAAVPTDRQPWMPVSGVARTVEHALSLPADIRGEDLVMAISRMPAPEYLLVEPDGTVFGVLSTDDVDRAFRSGSGR